MSAMQKTVIVEEYVGARPQQQTGFLPQLLVGVVLILASTLFFSGLGSTPFIDYDEAGYAQILRESFERGDFISFTFLDRPWFQKPPTLFWLSAVASLYISDIEFALRLTSALSGVLLVAAVMVCAGYLARSPYAAVCAGGLVLATFPILESARRAHYDIPVVAFLVLATYLFMRALERKGGFVPSFLSLGVAVMIKTVVAIFAVIPALIALALSRFRWWRSSSFWLGACAFVLVVVPWHAYMVWQFGRSFVDTYVGFSMVQRFGENVLALEASNLDYVYYLGVYAQPIVTLFLIALFCIPFVFNSMQPRARVGLIASCAAIFSILLVFSRLAQKYTHI